jgi:hypothetical protein
MTDNEYTQFTDQMGKTLWSADLLEKSPGESKCILFLHHLLNLFYLLFVEVRILAVAYYHHTHVFKEMKAYNSSGQTRSNME